MKQQYLKKQANHFLNILTKALRKSKVVLCIRRRNSIESNRILYSNRVYLFFLIKALTKDSLTLPTQSGVSSEEMARTFNCGLGMVLVVAEDRLKEVKRLMVDEDARYVGSLEVWKEG